MNPNAAEADVPPLLVLSQASAEQYEPGINEAVISITTPGDPPAVLSPAFADLLRMAIADTDVSTDPTGFSADTADRLLAFADAQSHRSRLVIHCHLGVSRSAGVAVGLMELFGWPLIFAEGVERPRASLPRANVAAITALRQAYGRSGRVVQPTPEQAVRLIGRPDAPGGLWR